MEKKRNVSILIPYKIENQSLFVFLQKREKNRKVLPGYFAFFGGKIEEGETSEQALEREIQEELCFMPKGYEFFGKYDFTDWAANVYFLKVSNNFEKEISVVEGEYGNFFSEDEIKNESMIASHDKDILGDFYRLLNTKK